MVQENGVSVIVTLTREEERDPDGTYFDKQTDMQTIACITRVRARPLNLGWCFLPSNVASDAPFLGRLWTNLAKILVDF